MPEFMHDSYKQVPLRLVDVVSCLCNGIAVTPYGTVAMEDVHLKQIEEFVQKRFVAEICLDGMFGARKDQMDRPLKSEADKKWMFKKLTKTPWFLFLLFLRDKDDYFTPRPGKEENEREDDGGSSKKSAYFVYPDGKKHNADIVAQKRPAVEFRHPKAQLATSLLEAKSSEQFLDTFLDTYHDDPNFLFQVQQLRLDMFARNEEDVNFPVVQPQVPRQEVVQRLHDLSRSAMMEYQSLVARMDLIDGVKKSVMSSGGSHEQISQVVMDRILASHLGPRAGINRLHLLSMAPKIIAEEDDVDKEKLWADKCLASKDALIRDSVASSALIPFSPPVPDGILKAISTASEDAAIKQMKTLYCTNAPRKILTEVRKTAKVFTNFHCFQKQALDEPAFVTVGGERARNLLTMLMPRHT